MVFPDGSLPPMMNGGFKSQDEFREYMMERHQEGNWDVSMQTRPTSLRVADHEGESLAKAFPLIFPYGHSGCAEDPALEKIKEKWKQPKTYLHRTRKHVLRKYLQHGKKVFHGALFNLIVSNILMKQKIFMSARLHANCKNKNGFSYGDQYGHLTADALKKAVTAVRNKDPIQYSSNPENEFLSSIHATCRNLPHSNEASEDARHKYFAFLAQFGMPAVFLTITPDDGRNYRIVLYARSASTTQGLPNLDISKASTEDILADFKTKVRCRVENPGLCAEEYHRIMILIIKHLFQWDEKSKSSKGQGCFGKLRAWTLATEEQGRKTLHGHFLLFIKDWPDLLRSVQLNDKNTTKTKIAQKTLLNYCNSIASAKLFGDFDKKKKLLGNISPFRHQCHDKPIRPKKKIRIEIIPVEDQLLRDMRHKQRCKILDGIIAHCKLCEKEFKVNEMVTMVLRYLLKDDHFEYPDENKKLEYLVTIMQHDRKWYCRDSISKATRYFIHNSLVNIHNHKHAVRCFKHSLECYANLPEGPIEKSLLDFKDLPDEWSDYKGCKEIRFMFRYYPQRDIEDAFMNVHSPVLTQCFANNTNVVPALNGPVVFYVTCYQVKKQQKEETEAYIKVFQCIIKMIHKRDDEEESDIPPCIQGFRLLIAAIYTQTSSHIISAPMAHYLALHESRFRYSHDTNNCPVIGIENFLLQETTKGTMRMRNGEPIWHHKAMDYIFRNNKFEEMSIFEYFKRVSSKRKYDAKKDGDKQLFDFTEKHPFHDTYTTVMHPIPCVAVFPWTWLGSTVQFQHPLTTKIGPTDTDFPEREQYCRRFLMLFIPFRSLEDLKYTMETFQDAFKFLEESDSIPKNVKEVANNIQDIHNSMNVTLPKNMLSATTCFDDTTEENTVEDKRHQAEQNSIMLEMLASTLTETSQISQPLVTMPTSISPILPKTKFDIPKVAFGKNHQQLAKSETVVYELSNTPSSDELVTQNVYSKRFICTVASLNCLVMRTLEDPENQNRTNKTDNATGSVQSIIRWCQNDGLDTKQQIAVEIMVATYVLTFYTDATGSETPLRKEDLRKIARQPVDKEETLRMFITGPAGSGKCKWNNPNFAFVCLISLSHINQKQQKCWKR